MSSGCLSASRVNFLIQSLSDKISLSQLPSLIYCVTTRISTLSIRLISDNVHLILQKSRKKNQKLFSNLQDKVSPTWGPRLTNKDACPITTTLFCKIKYCWLVIANMKQTKLRNILHNSHAYKS